MPAERAPAPLRIRPRTGYAPKLGELVSMLEYTRQTTLEAVQGLSTAQLDGHHGERGNSVGALLAHIAALEWAYGVRTFQGREPDAAERQRWQPAWALGAAARAVYHGLDLAFYLDLLNEVRTVSLAELKLRDDAWLQRDFRLVNGRVVNHHWAWFHVFEDELSHRGQILLIRHHLLPDGG